MGVDETNVCKYYLAGKCRYGDRCRFLHPPDFVEDCSYWQNYNDPYYQPSYYSGQSYTSPGRQQSYFHNQGQNQDYYQSPGNSYQNNRYRQNYRGQNYNANSESNYSKHTQGADNLHADYISSIAEYCNLIENCCLWPFTSFAFLADHGSLPGWDDYSPEEVRWAYYRAQIEGKIPAFEATIRELTKKMYGLRLIFLKPGKVAESILTDYLKQKVDRYNLPQAPNLFEPMTNRSTHPPSNILFSLAQPNSFSSKPQTTTRSDFSQWPASPTSLSNANIFVSSPSPSSAPQTFGNVGKNESNAMEMEGAIPHVARPPSENIFGRVSNVHNVAPQATSGSSSLFRGSSVFGEPTYSQTQQSKTNDMCYSRMEDLTVEEIEQFKAPKFTLDKLPLVPPPKALCGFT